MLNKNLYFNNLYKYNTTAELNIVYMYLKYNKDN